MSMLPAALLVLLSDDSEQLMCSFAALVTGFNFLDFGIGLEGTVACTFFVRMFGKTVTFSIEFLL